ncbi:MAG: DUF4199 domain-containing protein [Pseudomonadota bacterium]
MLRIALIYGGIAGAIVISVIIAGLGLGDGAHTGSQAFGYLVMLVALSLIFIGVKNYRDRDLGGVISFAQALGAGLAIAAVAGVIYVAVWEAYLAATDYAFMGDYAAGIIEKKKAAGVSGEDLDKLIADMEKMKASYANPLMRLPMTFLEIFPVGLIVSLVSAALLRNRTFMPAKA